MGTKKVDYKETRVFSGHTDIITYSYDGTTMIETTDGSGEAYTYSEIIDIKKDGTFTQEMTILEGNEIYKIKVSGVWSFVYGNKENKIKNKERKSSVYDRKIYRNRRWGC